MPHDTFWGSGEVDIYIYIYHNMNDTEQDGFHKVIMMIMMKIYDHQALLRFFLPCQHSITHLPYSLTGKGNADGGVVPIKSVK